jgi:hypothetical protein
MPIIYIYLQNIMLEYKRFMPVISFKNHIWFNNFLSNKLQDFTGLLSGIMISGQYQNTVLFFRMCAFLEKFHVYLQLILFVSY